MRSVCPIEKTAIEILAGFFSESTCLDLKKERYLLQPQGMELAQKEMLEKMSFGFKDGVSEDQFHKEINYTLDVESIPFGYDFKNHFARILWKYLRFMPSNIFFIEDLREREKWENLKLIAQEIASGEMIVYQTFARRNFLLRQGTDVASVVYYLVREAKEAGVNQDNIQDKDKLLAVIMMELQSQVKYNRQEE